MSRSKGTEMAITGGIELIKLLIVLAMQESQRAKMTPEQIAQAFSEAKLEFLANRPDNIPDV
jgi:hypothetical protein